MVFDEVMMMGDKKIKDKGVVLINGRSAVHGGSGGLLITQDVCLTGPQKREVTYHNVAQSTTATDTARQTFIQGHPACHQRSYFNESSGDEAGHHKGKHSKTIKQKAEFMSGSPNVFIEGKPAVRNREQMVSNQRNTAIGRLQQSNGALPNALKDSVERLQQPTKYPNQLGIAVLTTMPELLTESCVAVANNEQSVGELAGAIEIST